MVTKKTETEAAEAATEIAEDSKLDRAATIVTRYSAGSAAAGFIPMPAADIAAISAVQMKMLHSLSKLYGVPFTQEWAKSAVASLTGSVAADGIGRMGVASALKLIPGIGHVASMFAVPGTAWAATLALGQIFTRHFEEGGNLLNLNLKVWRPVFYEKVQTAAKEN